MRHHDSMLISILALARKASTAEERDWYFELAETCSRAARQEATKWTADYRRQIVEMLARAKHARTDEERAELFRTAEEWSERARGTEGFGRDNETFAEAGLVRHRRLLSVHTKLLNKLSVPK